MASWKRKCGAGGLIDELKGLEGVVTMLAKLYGLGGNMCSFSLLSVNEKAFGK